MSTPVADTHEGDGLLRASWFGTGALTMTAVPAVVAPSSTVVGLYVLVSLGLFAAGIVAFFAAYARAVGRSRYDAIGIGGLFFLAGTAPPRVQRHLMASLALETVVAFAAASLRVYTPVAFGILAPMYGLGIAGVWGARYGVFGPRRAAEPGDEDGPD